MDNEIKKLNFTAHGVQRTLERSLLSLDEMSDLLLSDSALTIGEDGNRQHILVYSKKDEFHYVGIIDRKTWDVITLLPFDYHSRCAFVIQPIALDYTRKKAFGLPASLFLEATPKKKKKKKKKLEPSQVEKPVKMIKRRLWVDFLIFGKPASMAVGKVFYKTEPVTAQDAALSQNLKDVVADWMKNHKIPKQDIKKLYLRVENSRTLDVGWLP